MEGDDTTNKIELEGLVVKEGSGIDVPGSSAGVSTKVLYLKGRCLKAGALNTDDTNYVGYYAGKSTDQSRVTTY